MVNSELTEYIRSSLAAGYGIRQLREQLVSKGWEPSLVGQTMAPFIALHSARQATLQLWFERLLCLGMALLAAGMGYLLHFYALQ